MSAAAGKGWMQRLRGLKFPWSLAVILIFSASVALELAEDYEVLQPRGCTYQQEQHERWSERLYGPLMRLRFGMLRHPRVGTVTIDGESEPLKVMNNTCEGRRFLSNVVPLLKEDGAQVIVIDKFYSEGSCVQEDVNEAFRAALTRPSSTGRLVPVVVGQAANKRESGKPEEACLQLAEPFNFSGKGADPRGPPVELGLTRLNADSLKIPLEWFAFAPAEIAPSATTTPLTSKVEPYESLALKGAMQARRGIRGRPDIERALKLREHPFGRFNELPHWHAMDVLCSGWNGAHTMVNGGWGSCPTRSAGDLQTPISEIRDKVIVIGERSDTDLQPTRGKERYGVELQASYIEDLLDETYMRRVPLWGELAMLMSFVACTFALEVLEEERKISARRSYWLWFSFYLLLIVFNLALVLFFDRLSSIFLSASWIMLAIVVSRGAFLLRQTSIKKLHGTSEGRAE